MSRTHDYLIILSHATNTGIMIFPNREMSGRDMMIVGLKRDVPTGENFEMQDIDWIKAVLHFADVNALKTTVEVMSQELKRWEKEE